MVGLASKELVWPYLAGSSLVESVELVGRLHLVVELAAACQSVLSLPPASLKPSLHSALTTLRTPAGSGGPDQPVLFTFPLLTADVKVSPLYEFLVSQHGQLLNPTRILTN